METHPRGGAGTVGTIRAALVGVEAGVGVAAEDKVAVAVAIGGEQGGMLTEPRMGTLLTIVRAR